MGTTEIIISILALGTVFGIIMYFANRRSEASPFSSHSHTNTCPHCGKPLAAVPLVHYAAPQKQGVGFLGGCFLVILSVVGLAVVVFLFAAMIGSRSPTASDAPTRATTQPNDDLELFISKYGPPDSQDSTEHDRPRPPIVTRFLIYDAEHVRAVYVPDAKVGTRPPYRRWKLMGFQDSRDNSVLRASEVDERLNNRKTQ